MGARLRPELALDRGSPDTNSPIAVDRVLLLVKALQEQCRWSESLGVRLEGAQESGVKIDEDEALVLREWARAFSENPSDAESATILERLGEITASSQKVATRLGAAKLIATICSRGAPAPPLFGCAPSCSASLSRASTAMGAQPFMLLEPQPRFRHR